ncbi:MULTISPECIES: ABC transporter permease [Corynebacterium]|uniref:ABC-type antimicrobial peptide transport system n=1 Tax=Corynebacterium ramonii TaxID=3026968 RepID=A0ABN4EKZ9_9CORY|nr:MULTISPECIES: FtsX-like permease family protein [Corynebacterium]AIU33328.1 ABC-type antimicrobial peptide transport system [Corynebacterium ramonii FRC0011]ESU58123.1 ABC transporter permease [Corynebacterium ulcerans NCTC 12077]STC82606.1 antimicrobial peptide ABC transporter [Corynebacterium ulcerans]
MGQHSAKGREPSYPVGSPNKDSSTAMLRVSIRSVLAHKVRLALTLLAVVLGTAFVSGSLMFTASLSKSFDAVVDDNLAGIDAVVSGKENPITVAEIEQLRADKNVKAVDVNGSTNVVVATSDRKAIQTGAGQASVSIFHGEGSASNRPVKITEGAAPKDNADVVIATGTASAHNIKVGDSLLVIDAMGQREVNVVGTYEPASSNTPGLTLLTSEEGYLANYTQGSVGSVIVKSAGMSSEDLVKYLSETYPQYKVDTGDAIAEQITGVIKKALSFVNYFLVAFGLIALLVGTFIIANTFSMIVAQRLKEFALLRALGVSRKQLTRSVVFEAVIIGLVGSIIGIFGGMGLVKLIQFVMAKFGMEIPAAGLGLTVTSVLLPLALGTIVTVVSAWAPARRAGAVRPVEAMRSTETASESSLKVRTIFGVVGIGLGIAAALVGIFAEDAATKTRAISVGVGALFVIVGVFAASPAISIPVVGALGRVLGAPFGAVGKLSATNSRRNPKRTATTAFALTLGVALVTTIGMLSATMKSSISDLVNSEVKAEFILSGPQGGHFPVPAEAEQKVREVEGVGSVTSMGFAPVTLGTAKLGAASHPRGTALVNGKIDDVVKAEGVEGSLDLTEADRVVAKKSYLEAQNLKVGDQVPLRLEDGTEIAHVTIVGSFSESKVLNDVIASSKTIEGKNVLSTTSVLFVNGNGTKTTDELRDGINKAVEDFLVVRVQTSKEYAGEQSSTITQMMNILYALLGLAVVIAIIGIINTLALNVIERRQEIGMLRAVGTQRRQIRTMISIESVQIALYGAVVGIVIGLGLGWAFLKVLSSQGLGTISIPIAEILWLLVGSAVVGVVAALWPARRAAKTPPLDAIAD